MKKAFLLYPGLVLLALTGCTNVEVENGEVRSISGFFNYYGVVCANGEVFESANNRDIFKSITVDAENGEVKLIKVETLTTAVIFKEEGLLKNPAVLETAKKVLNKCRNYYLKECKKRGFRPPPCLKQGVN